MALDTVEIAPWPPNSWRKVSVEDAQAEIFVRIEGNGDGARDVDNRSHVTCATILISPSLDMPDSFSLEHLIDRTPCSISFS